MLFYLLVILAIAVWRFVARYWKPSIVTEIEHYEIPSTATPTDGRHRSRGGDGLPTSREQLNSRTPVLFVFEQKVRKRPPIGTMDVFEELIGPVDAVQTEWHAHVLKIKADLEKPEAHR